MARSGYPSMTALLALVAIAGYQNRDKIAEMLGGGSSSPSTPTAPGQPASGGLLGGLGGLLGGLLGGTTPSTPGNVVDGGLGELVDRFRENGKGEVADSWVAAGPNKNVTPNDLEQAIGPDVLDELSTKTGLSREELLSRLTKELPSAVDRYTPEGRLPSAG